MVTNTTISKEKIRFYKDELSKAEWWSISISETFTFDELREFANYIDWTEYYNWNQFLFSNRERKEFERYIHKND